MKPRNLLKAIPPLLVILTWFSIGELARRNEDKERKANIPHELISTDPITKEIVIRPNPMYTGKER